MTIKQFCKKYILAFPFFEVLVFAVILSFDLVSKHIAAHYAPYEQDFLGSLVQFTYTFNTGAAWSFLADKAWAPTFFICVSSVASCGFIAYLVYSRKNPWLMRLALTMIIAGAIGNLIDRIALGGVRDFISVSFFSPIFNIADSSLTVGVVLFMVFYIFFYKEKKKDGAAEVKDAQAEPQGADDEGTV